MKIKELFTKLAETAGVDTSSDAFKTALAAMPDTDIDDDAVATPLVTNLITQEQVLADPKVKNKMMADSLHIIDKTLEGYLSEFLDASEVDAVKGDKSTKNRLIKILDKAKAAKAAGNNPVAAKELERLNEEINRLKTDSESQVNTLKAQYDEERFFTGRANRVIRRDDVVDYAKAKDGQRFINDLKDTLRAAGGVIDYATGEVRRADDPSSPLYGKNNKKLTLDDLETQTLTENQYLKKSDPPPANPIRVDGGSDKDKPKSTADSVALANLKGIKDQLGKQADE